MDRPTRVAVLGLGMAANGILRRLSRASGIEIVASVSSRPAAREAFSKQYNSTGYPTLEALCEAPDVDAVWVATPSEHHYEHAITLAQHGKHVVMEKPFGTTLDSATA